jgi:hypothetical protein
MRPYREMGVVEFHFDFGSPKCLLGTSRGIKNRLEYEKRQRFVRRHALTRFTIWWTATCWLPR